MSDALLNPVVGGAFWIASGALIAYSAKKIKDDKNERAIPLMGVMSAFVFAAQMINFTVPGTGSSGHLGGGLLLAIFLGPYRGFLAIASVLVIQCLFFADGGLMALGSNIFNIGVPASFIVYPLIWKKMVKKESSGFWSGFVIVISALVVLQIGALGVVLQTVMSGISDLPFGKFLIFMTLIHLVIGLVEGLVTMGVLLFVKRMKPELLSMETSRAPGKAGYAIAVLALVAILTGGFLSWFASSNPDGLEWSISKTSGKEELEAPETGTHGFLSRVIGKLAFLPDYGFKSSSGEEGTEESESAGLAGTSISGLVGLLLVMALALVLGYGIRRFNKKPSTAEET
jgi:cobalt/nickel transport system permease protein